MSSCSRVFTNLCYFYFFSLSRNHILDLSDASKDSQLTRMSKQERETILKKNFPIPSTQAKDFTPIEKHIKVNISVIKNISLHKTAHKSVYFIFKK